MSGYICIECKEVHKVDKTSMPVENDAGRKFCEVCGYNQTHLTYLDAQELEEVIGKIKESE